MAFQTDDVSFLVLPGSNAIFDLQGSGGGYGARRIYVRADAWRITLVFADDEGSATDPIIGPGLYSCTEDGNLPKERASRVFTGGKGEIARAAGEKWAPSFLRYRLRRGLAPSRSDSEGKACGNPITRLQEEQSSDALIICVRAFDDAGRYLFVQAE